MMQSLIFRRMTPMWVGIFLLSGCYDSGLGPAEDAGPVDAGSVADGSVEDGGPADGGSDATPAFTPYAVLAVRRNEGEAVFEVSDFGSVTEFLRVPISGDLPGLSNSPSGALFAVYPFREGEGLVQQMRVIRRDGSELDISWPASAGACATPGAELGGSWMTEGATESLFILCTDSDSNEDLLRMDEDGSVTRLDIPPGCRTTIRANTLTQRCDDDFRTLDRDGQEVAFFDEVPPLRQVTFLSQTEIAYFGDDDVARRIRPSGVDEGYAWPPETTPFLFAEVAPHGQLAVSMLGLGGGDFEMRVFEPWTGENTELTRCTFSMPFRAGFGVYWSPVSTQALVNCNAGLTLLDVPSGSSTVVTAPDADTDFYNGWFSQDGARILVMRQGEEIRWDVFDTETGELTPLWRGDVPEWAMWLRQPPAP